MHLRDKAKFRVGFGNVELRKAIIRTYLGARGGKKGIEAIWQLVNDENKNEDEDEEDWRNEHEEEANLGLDSEPKE